MSQSTTSQHPAAPAFDFSFDESLSQWNMPYQEWLTKNNKTWHGIATGCLVFNEENKLLLIQRASHDSMPNRWEFPGGAADPEDSSIFYSAARELWEEAGLMAKQFTHLVTDGSGQGLGQVFTNRTGTRFFCRFSFNVEVESCEQVKLDPNEHQDFVWATEDEIRQQKIGERPIPITTRTVLANMLEAFRLRNERT